MDSFFEVFIVSRIGFGAKTGFISAPRRHHLLALLHLLARHRRYTRRHHDSKIPDNWIAGRCCHRHSG